MIDREPLPRSDNSGAQASECSCGQPRGAAAAAGAWKIHEELAGADQAVEIV